MTQIKPGHRLYLYRLFARELGVGKQTALSRAAEVLEADGLDPADLGFVDARSLFEALGECVKLTVFKKGAIFVTVLANEEYDQALARAQKNSGKSAATKSFKRQRGVKNVKPQKPKHIEKKKPAPEPAADSEPVPTSAEETAPTDKRIVAEAVTEAEAAADAEVDAATESVIDDVVNTGIEFVFETDAAANAEVAAEPDPEAIQEPGAAREQEPESVAAQKAAAPQQHEAKPAPVIDPEPPIKFTITYTPEPVEDEPVDAEPIGAEPALAEPVQAAPEPVEPAPESTRGSDPEPTAKLGPAAQGPSGAQSQSRMTAPASAPTPAPAPKPAPAPSPRPARPANDLPQDFYADVCVTDEPLSALYQVLPLDVDPVATLEEDFRIARSTGALEGTRSEVKFPMRFQRRDGSPVMVTLRRRARSVAGKHWSLANVAVDAPEEVGMGALERKPAGPWAAFADKAQLKEAQSPEAELAQFAVLGSWDKLLEELAALAAPEDWGKGRAALREYLAMRYRRVARQHLVAMTDDGSSAAFDTGLLTADGEPIAAVLEPHDGDILWELTCFSVNAQARPATWPQMPATDQIAQELLATDDPSLRRTAARVVRDPRAATQAYDAANDAVYVLVPKGSGAYALGHGPVGLSDARICARAISADQPAWLR